MAFPFESSIQLTDAACQIIFSSTTAYIEESADNIVDHYVNSACNLRIDGTALSNSGAVNIASDATAYSALARLDVRGGSSQAIYASSSSNTYGLYLYVTGSGSAARLGSYSSGGNNARDGLLMTNNTPSGGAVDLSLSVLFQLDNAAGAFEDAGRIGARWTDVTASAEESELLFGIMTGGTYTEVGTLGEGNFNLTSDVGRLTVNIPSTPSSLDGVVSYHTGDSSYGGQFMGVHERTTGQTAAANDNLMWLQGAFYDAAATPVLNIGARLEFEITDVTLAAEEVRMNFFIMSGGSMTNHLLLAGDGLEYLADHSTAQSANDRWIPDKAYVDTAVAGAGTSNVSVTNQGDNRIVTSTATTDELNAEANLLFDGTDLSIVSGSLKTDTINEYTVSAGVTVEGVLLNNNNIYLDTNVSATHNDRYIYWGDATDGWDTYIRESVDDVLQIITGNNLIMQLSTGIVMYGNVTVDEVASPIGGYYEGGNQSLTWGLYSNTASHNHVYRIYRYGGTYPPSTAAPANAVVHTSQYHAYDGSSSLEAARYEVIVDGTPSTGSVSMLHRWSVRETTGSLTTSMELEADGGLQLHQYGSNSFTGTVAYALAVDSSGNVIETTFGSGDVSWGTASNHNVVLGGGSGDIETNSALDFNPVSNTLDIGVSGTTPWNRIGTSSGAPIIYQYGDATSNQFYSFVYSNTATHTPRFGAWRYGGTYSSNAAAPTNATIWDADFRVYDGTSIVTAGGFSFEIDGTVATNNFNTKFTWDLKVGSSAEAEKMYLDSNGLTVIDTLTLNTIEAGTGGTGVFIEGVRMYNDYISVYNSGTISMDIYAGGTVASIYTYNGRNLQFYPVADSQMLIGNTTNSGTFLTIRDNSASGFTRIINLLAHTGGASVFNVQNDGAIYMPVLGSDDTEDHVVAIDDSTGLLTKRAVSSFSSPWQVNTNLITVQTAGDDVRLNVNEVLQFNDATSYISGGAGTGTIYIYAGGSNNMHFAASSTVIYHPIVGQNNQDLGGTGSAQWFSNVYAGTYQFAATGYNINTSGTDMRFTDGSNTNVTLSSLVEGASQWTTDTNGITYTAGNVGINAASSATAELYVDEGGSTNHVVHINANAARAASTYALYIDDGDTNSRGSLRIESEGTLPLSIDATGIAQAVIKGNTTSASIGSVLRMISSAAIRARGMQFENDATAAEWFCGVGYNISDDFTIGYDATGGQPEYSTNSYFRVSTGGYMSIGAGPNSGYTLYIDNAQSGANVTLGLDRTSGQPTIKALGDQYMIIDSNGQFLSLNHYVSDNVQLASGGGNVGLGVTASSTARTYISSGTTTNHVLHVYGSAARGASRYALYIDDNDTNSRGTVKIDSTSGVALRIDSTSAETQFDFSNNSLAFNVRTFVRDSDDNYGLYDVTNAFTFFRYVGNATAGSRTLTVMTSGSFGVGATPSTSYKLDVSGAVRITTSLRVGGTTLTSGYILELSGSNNKGRAADWTATSDIRLKTNISKYGTVLCGIMSLHKSEYGLSLYNRRILNEEGKPTEKFTKEVEVGYIAQDMMKAFPSIVNGSEEEFYDISYMRAGAIALAGVAELKDEKDREIDALQRRVKILEDKLAKYGDNNN